MKKVFNSLFVIIAAMVTFAGCAKQEIDAPATPETKTVQFFANSIETKTEFGTPVEGVYPTLWSAGDKVKILVNLDQLKDTEKTVDVECSDDFKSARFKAELADPQTESYTFYSISPSTKLLGKPAGKLYVEIKNAQTPLATSVDKEAQLLFAKSKTTETMPTSVDLNYQHLTAYGKFSLANLADESVLSIKIEAPEDVYLAGKWDYVIADDNLVVRTGNGLNAITLTTSSTTDIWFACAPVDVSNKTLTLTVTTENGDFVKSLNFPENRKFEAGKISKFTVDMTGITAGGSEEPEQPGETTAYYEKVTSAPTDWSGKYLLVNETAAKALSAISTTSTKYGLGTDVTISNEKIIATDALSKCQVEISKATVNSNAYVMMFGGKYLTWTSGNSLNVATSESANTNWIITLSDGNAVIKNSQDNTRQIFWNPQSPRFACYNKDGQSAVQLYVLVDSNEGGSETPEPEEPETPVLTVTSTSKNVACDVTEASFEIVSNQNWTVVPGEGVSVNVTSGSGNGTVTMTFDENTSEEAVVYTATVKAEGFEDIVLTVTQSGVPQEGGDEGGSEGPLTIVLSAATKPCDTFPDTSTGVTTTTTYTIDGYEWTFSPSSGNKFSWYPNDKYILWGKTGGYILLPAVEGKKLTSVTILTGKGASTSVKVGVFTADGTSAVSGGEAKTLNAKNAEFTWTLTGTEVNTHYQLRVTSNHNAQLQTLTLIYE